jgi:hypothetical protein
MKRSIILLFVICIAYTNPAFPQGLLKKAGRAVTDEVLGNGSSSGTTKMIFNH